MKDEPKMEYRSDMTVELIDHMGDDLSVAKAARVSTLGEKSKDKNEAPYGLINFLMANRHGTPFEHNSFTFLVSAPIFVFREFMRHRIGFSYNEESGRYRQLKPVFYVPDQNRNLVQQGKPGAYEFVPGNDGQYEHMSILSKAAYEVSYDHYLDMLETGIAREVARQILPVGIYSSMYVTCNARSLMAFLSLRTKSPDSKFPSFPQREIEMVAEQMEVFFKDAMPITHETFNKNGRVSP